MKKKYVAKYYFAYGSNLHLQQMKQRCPDSEPVTIATLRDYSLTFKGNWKENGVADVFPNPGDKVEGALYRVSNGDLNALDGYEGYPTLYKRFDITVELPDGSTVEAFVYRMNPQYIPLPPSDYYYNVIAEGFRNWNIPLQSLEEARDNLLREPRPEDDQEYVVFRSWLESRK